MYTTWVEHKNGTSIFYFAFKERDGFIEHLSTRKKMKEGLNALSMATSISKNTLRIVMPFGTNVKGFQNKVHAFLNLEYSFYQSTHNGNAMSDFMSGFGGGRV